MSRIHLARRATVLATSSALALGAAALGLATAAQAASGSTAAIKGATANAFGMVWYDDGSFPMPGTNPGPNRTVTLNAEQQGADVKVTVTVSAGPNTSVAPAPANSYQLDAYVRLDGAANTRGTHFDGPKGAVDVAANSTTFAGGATITGTFKNVSPGQHTFTLTDLLMDTTGGSSGGFDDAPIGFDTFYNAGNSFATIVTAPTDWAIADSLTVVDETGPKVKLTEPSKPGKVDSWKTIKGTSSDVSGVKSVSVKLTQKRGKDAYFYTGSEWKEAGSMAKAKDKASAVKATVKANGNWTVEVKKLKAGTLTIRYWGVDDLGNKPTVKEFTTKSLD